MNETDRTLSSIFLIPLTLVIVGVFLFMALLNGQRELTVLSLAVIAIAAGAKLWTRWSLAKIRCRVGLDRRRLFPDEKLALEVTAENRKILPVRLEVRAPVGGLVRGESAVAEVRDETGLLWYQKASFRWELTALRRGVHRIGPVTIVSGDLFGFFPKEKEVADTVEVVVYPRLVPLKTPSLPRRDFFGVPGSESPVDDPVYILGTRDYQHGRPAKHIHWKATARHHKLQEKIFEPSSQEKILLVIDVAAFARSGAAEPFERMLEQAASSAVRLAERGCAVGLAMNGRMNGDVSPIVPVTRNPGQPAILLEALARVQMAPASGLIETLSRHLRVPWGVTCLYFSCEKDETAQAARDFFTRRRVPFRFHNGDYRTDSGPAGAPAAPAASMPGHRRNGEGAG